MNGSSLPPCSRVLKEKLKRTKLVANLWMNATLPHLPALNPDEHGWKVDDNGTFGLSWFEGDATPASIEEIVVEQVENDPLQEDWVEEEDETEMTDDEYASDDEVEDD